MIDRAVRFSLSFRFIIITLSILCVGLGVLALRRLPIEAYPDVTNVQVQVITQYPGRAAEEVEKVITIPIEKAMNSVPRIMSLRSISIFSLSVVTIVFEDGTNPYFARQQVTEVLNTVTLPEGILPTLAPLYTVIGEIYRYTLEGPPGMDLVELKAIEDWVVEKELRTVPGVVGIVGFGGPTKQYHVRLKPEALKAYGITLNETFEALARGNINAGGSIIEHGSEVYTVRGLGLVKTISDIENIVVKAREGVPITVKNIAVVGIGSRVRLGMVGMNERDDVVASIVLLRRGDNPLEVLKRVRAKVDEINESLSPLGVNVVPHYDRTTLTHKTLHTIAENLIAGILLVVGVLILYLGIHNIRAAFIVALVVPMSLLLTFILLDLRGVPANLLSLGAIDFGIIVDAAIVIVENIIRHLNAQKNPIAVSEIISYATREVGNPAIFAKLILIITFIPVFSFQRVEGRIFTPMAYTLCFAFLGSLLFSFTLIPTLCSLFLRPSVASESFIIRFLREMYVRVVTRTVSHSWITVGIGIGLFIGSFASIPFLGSEFLPQLDEGALWVRVTMPPNISMSMAVESVHGIRSILQEFPEVINTVSQLGRPDDGTDVNGFDNTEIFVDLEPRNKWKTAKTRDELVKKMQERLSSVPGVILNFSQPIKDNVDEAVSGVKGELVVKIFGPDVNKLEELATQVVKVMSTVRGVTDLARERLGGQTQIQIEIDRSRIARYGISIADVQQVVEVALGGKVATVVLEGERRFELNVRFLEKEISNVDQIKNILISASDGTLIPMSQLATVTVRQGFARLYREANSSRIAVKCSIRGRDLGSLVAEGQKKVKTQVTLPPEYKIVWSGAFENQRRAMKRLAIIVPVCMFIIVAILYTAFLSIKSTLLVLINTIFSSMGAFFALAIIRMPISVSALVGMVALSGVATMYGVIIVSYINQLRSENPQKSLQELIVEGIKTRFNAVLMAGTVGILGLLPAAVSTKIGSEIQRPFAVAIVGGLISATILSLLVLPALYNLMMGMGVRRPGKLKEGSARHLPVPPPLS